MVFLLLDPAALQETLELAKQAGAHVWLGSEAISEKEHKLLCASGSSITRFSYELRGSGREVVEGALLTVKEHHPGEVIWVQHAS
jgi:hypothetical protein